MSVITYTLTSGNIAGIDLSMSPAEAFLAGLLLFCGVMAVLSLVLK